MISVIVAVVDRPEKFLKSVREISTREDVQITVGVTRAISGVYDFKMPNVSVKVFEDKSTREEIINALQSVLLGEAVFIARKPFSQSEFDKFVSSDGQIMLCEKPKRNAVQKFFVGLWEKLVKTIFGVKFFKGDPSLIYFDGVLGSVLTNVDNLSYCTRVDRWKGVSQETVHTAEPKASPTCNKTANLKLVLFALLSLAIGALATTLICIFVKVSVVIGLLIACLDVICLAISILLLFMYFFNRSVGSKDVKRAIEG